MVGTCMVWLLPRSQHLTCLSQLAMNTLLPSSCQQVSRMGPPMVCCALGTVVAWAVISQHLTLLSQEPATRKLFGTEGGEKAREEMESSGGLDTSISLLGLAMVVVVAEVPKAVLVEEPNDG